MARSGRPFARRAGLPDACLLPDPLDQIGARFRLDEHPASQVPVVASALNNDDALIDVRLALDRISNAMFTRDAAT
jgi:hypothetical protein